MASVVWHEELAAVYDDVYAGQAAPSDAQFDPATTAANLAAKTGAFHDVTVDCLGTIAGWKAVDSADTYEYARVDLLRAVPPGTAPDAGTCSNGRHVATSEGAFGLVVYGLDTYSSYGYPAGGNAAVLSGVVCLLIGALISYMELRRLPELFCGFARRPPGPEPAVRPAAACRRERRPGEDRRRGVERPCLRRDAGVRARHKRRGSSNRRRDSARIRIGDQWFRSS